MRISDWSSDMCASDLAILSAGEAFSRAVIAGVIPLEAHALLVEAQVISLAYAGVGIVAFATSFMVPLVLLKVRRKWIFSAGTLCMVAAPLLMLLSQALPFVTALQVRSLAVVCVNIALNLYIRSEEHTSELQSLMRISYAVFCLKKKTHK